MAGTPSPGLRRRLRTVMFRVSVARLGLDWKRRRRMKLSALVLWGAAALFCSTIHAESLRCNGDLAQIGESKASVLQKCGQPFFVDSFCTPANEIILPPSSPGSTTVNVLPCEQVDEWSYNPGYGQF